MSIGYREPTTKQYATFGKQVAALMGSNPEWDSAADYLEFIADFASGQLGISVGGQDAELLAFWRGVADEVGVYYESDEGEEP
jgi:hypothetical protein